MITMYILYLAHPKFTKQSKAIIKMKIWVKYIYNVQLQSIWRNFELMLKIHGTTHTRIKFISMNYFLGPDYKEILSVKYKLKYNFFSWPI